MNIQTIPSSVDYLYRRQANWDHNPPYQRPGGQWGLRQKQRFIDSLLNNFPVPPIYLHKDRSSCAVVDGKQRLETIREFIDGVFPLAKDFELLERSERLSSAPRPGDYWSDFSPAWRTELLGYTVPMVEVSFASPDNTDALVRQIFLRLNSGTKMKREHLEKVKQQLQGVGA